VYFYKPYYKPPEEGVIPAKDLHPEEDMDVVQFLKPLKVLTGHCQKAIPHLVLR
jgi:hypothetical protein